MSFETITWGRVEVGHIVRDKNDRLHMVAAWPVGDAIVSLIPAHGRGEPVAIQRPPADRPVDIYVPTEAEALELLDRELGARILRDIEEREHTIARSLMFRMDPVPRRAVALRDHIDWLHGANVDDVLRRWQGTEANPSDATRKKSAVEELALAHDEMHARPDLWPHNRAHHHGGIS